MKQTWTLYQQAKAWRCRPSELLAIEEVYPAYCLDEAVWTFGSYVQHRLDEVEGKNRKEIERRQQQIMGELLELPVEQRFKPFRRPR